MTRYNHGQSTLEYILVVAAILVAVIVAANQFVKPAVSKSMEDSSSVITGATSQLKTRLGLDGGNTPGGGSTATGP